MSPHSSWDYQGNRTPNASYTWSIKTDAEKGTKLWNKSSSQVARQNSLRAINLTAIWLLSAMKKSKAKTSSMLVTQAQCPRVQCLLQQTLLLPRAFAYHLACQDISWQTLRPLSTAVQPHQETVPRHLTSSTFTLALQPTQRCFPPTALASLGA